MKGKEHNPNSVINKKVLVMLGIILIVIALIIAGSILIFEQLGKQYTVTFSTNCSAQVEPVVIDENSTVTKPKDPVRDGYEFMGWYYNDKLFDFSQPIEGDIKLEAKWALSANPSEDEPDDEKNTSTIKKYEVIFKDVDGSILLETQKVKEGNQAVEPQEPKKEGHTFKGWYNGKKLYTFQDEVNEDVELIAKWTKNDYTITFINFDGRILDTKTLAYGSTIEYTGETPIKQPDNTYTYLFKGWDKELTSVRGNTIYTATFNGTYIDYTITLLDEDGTELSKKIYHYGDKIEEPTPTKAGNEKYSYIFAGWIPDMTTVKKDETYTASYTEEINKYEVTFKDEDGTILSDTQAIEYQNKAIRPEKPIKEGHTFQGWYNGETLYTFAEEVTENVELTAKWTKNKYTITFESYDGTVLETQVLEYGEIPAYTGEIPTKEANNTFTYTFAGWTPNITRVKENTTYTIVFDEVYIEYVITFVNEDGTELSEKTYHYGDKVQQPIATKPADAQYTYTFAGWTPNVTIVKEDMTYKATYTATINIYEVTFVDTDGSILSNVQTIKYGNKVTEPKDPTKEGHTFQGWYNGETPYTFTDEVKENIELTAKWTKNKYTITFENYDGTVLETKTLEYDTLPTYTGEEPTKESNKQYKYIFTGWIPNITPVKKDTTYTATFEQKDIDYTIIFENYDGTELSKKTYHYGDTVEEPENPTKPADAQYTYTFSGWTPNVEIVEDDATYKATYTKTVNSYEVTFENYDGTVLENKTLEYGQTPTYTGETPTKSADNTYTYSFKGWDKEIMAVTGNATYTAIFDATYIDYTITFVNEDGTELSKKTYHYGDTVEKPEAPTKPAGAQYTYVFVGWIPNVTTVEKDATYMANFKTEVNSYEVTFKNDDGTVLETKTVKYGEVPTYTGKTPTKQADNTYTYSFKGWDKVLTATTEHVTYTATFDKKYIDYTIIFVDEDGTELSKKTYHYGDKVEQPGAPTKAANAQYTYTFVGWTPNVTIVKKDATYKATYTKTVNRYSVTFKNYDGTVLETKTVEYGKVPTYTGKTPTKQADNTYTYPFKGWNKEITAVRGDATYTATFNQVYINYTIIFVNDDGAELSKKTYHYGDKVKEPNAPTKLADAQYTYTFAGWTPNVTLVKKDATYKATYTATVNSYKVTFEDDNGTTLSDTQTVKYGSTATKPKEPIKEGYKFVGWYNGETLFTFEEIITSNIKLTAKWAKNEYTITFVNYDDTVLETQTVKHGKTPTYTKETPTRPTDAQYTYKFAGWTPNVTAAKENMTYKATYTGTTRKYNVTFKDESGIELSATQIVEYGSKATEPEEPTKELHTFEGWYNGKTKYTFTEEVKGNVDLIAKFAKLKYTIIFVNYDDTVLETQEVEPGQTPVYTNGTPTRPSDSTYSYTFTGWSPAITAAEKNMTYKATYKSFVDVDKKIENATSQINANEFTVTKTDDTINVEFRSYKSGNTTVKPPYELTDLAGPVVRLLDRLSSDPAYESFDVSYKDKTIDLTDYDLTDTSNLSALSGVINWLTHLCGKSSIFGLMSATSDNLVGKTVTITIKLKAGYTLEDGSTSATYKLIFSEQ